ncbi:MAG: hypothetical protein ACYC3F_06855 [Gemmatimonadaceae bacterium]
MTVWLGLALACSESAEAPTVYSLPQTPSANAVCATLTPMYRAMPDATSLPAWLEIFARIVPGGYAGYDAMRARPTLLLVDTTRFGAAKDNIAALYRCTDFPSHLGFALPTEAVGTARYDFTRLNAWDKLLTSALGKASGVRTRQFDLPHNQILVFVVDASAANEVRGAVRSAGIPDDAVATSIVVKDGC